jgi:cell division ATPase FtsA
METTPQTPQQQDIFKTIVDKGAISDLLSFLGRVFGNSELIAAAKIELSLMQDAYIKATEQKAEAKLCGSIEYYDGVLDAAKEVLESLEWEQDVCIKYPTHMDVDCDGGDLSVSYVEGSVSLSMSRSDVEEVAKDIVRRVKGEC